MARWTWPIDAELAPHLRSAALVVGKSTVPVGTAHRMAQRIAELAPHPDVEVAWNPEFLREGFAVKDTLGPDRIVVGVTSARAEETLREVYAAALADGVPWVATDLATAEHAAGECAAARSRLTNVWQRHRTLFGDAAVRWERTR